MYDTEQHSLTIYYIIQPNAGHGSHPGKGLGIVHHSFISQNITTLLHND